MIDIYRKTNLHTWYLDKPKKAIFKLNLMKNLQLQASLLVYNPPHQYGFHKIINYRHQHIHQIKSQTPSTFGLPNKFKKFIIKSRMTEFLPNLGSEDSGLEHGISAIHISVSQSLILLLMA